MITIQVLGEWAIRSSILILSGALLLRVLRVKDPSIRLAAWTAMLCGSVAIPLLTTALPKIPLAVMRTAVSRQNTEWWFTVVCWRGFVKFHRMGPPQSTLIGRALR